MDVRGQIFRRGEHPLKPLPAGQRWRFLVIRDAKDKETVGAFKRAWDEQVAPRYRSGGPAPGTGLVGRDSIGAMDRLRAVGWPERSTRVDSDAASPLRVDS